jgi:aldehyde dehydrogenase (NAD+)
LHAGRILCKRERFWPPADFEVPFIMQALQEKITTGQIDAIFSNQRKSMYLLRKEPVSARQERLKKLRDWIHKNRPAIHEAAYRDFQKPPVEIDGIEIFHVLQEIRYALDNLESWAKPVKVNAPVTMLGTRSFIQYEPRGVCLIISPWNYPFSLAIGPLVSALAAGNSVILKPSELTPHVSSLINTLARETFAENIVAVCEGGPEISRHLLSLPFDHIFFTGSPAIGKVVMKAAAENLTSVTLELGGKSPAIITGSANIRDAAQRTAVAKFVNNGQTCVAPDYVLVDEKIADAFVDALISQTKKLFTENGEPFEESKSYCRIVNDRHFDRLNELLQDALTHGATLAFGGKVDKASRFIHPMILTHIHSGARLLEEEIFGPILPVLTYKTIEEAINIVNAKPKALALYIFTANEKVQLQILAETSAGGVCVNDCGIHFLHHGLPFGGVNNSGIGKSHGHFGFLAFSNEKPVLKQRTGLTSVKAFYPPYTSRSKKLMDWFLKLF